MNRRQRLRGHARFAAVRSKGLEGRAAGIRVRLHRGPPASRAGFAIPGARGAVERNRLRRRLRAVVGPLLANHPGYDMVVSAVPQSPEPSFQALQAAVERAVTQALSRVERR